MACWRPVLCALSLVACGDDATPAPQDDSERLSGGDATVFASDADAFTHPVPTLDRDDERVFYKGRALFRDNWVQAPSSTTSRDGLGPLFNARACITCHVRDGRGRPPFDGEQMVQMFLRFTVPGEDAFGAPLGDPTYGDQLNPFAVPGVPAEGDATIDHEIVEGSYADGEPFELLRPSYMLALSYGPLQDDAIATPRVARHLIGLGLLAAIDEADILEGAGRPNYVWDHERAALALGRFGWKATQPSVVQQSALAFLHDIGLTTETFPAQPCTALQAECVAADSGGDPEVQQSFLANVAFYSETLAVPARRDWDAPEVLRGKALFEDMGCAHCHTPKHVTGSDGPIAELRDQTIYPYTDLLLHDMGEELSDQRAEFDAGPRDWRTPPLWGIGLIETVNDHLFLLHDGRARGFAEAILWHGGEAEPVREAFRKLSRPDREAVLRFLESL